VGVLASTHSHVRNVVGSVVEDWTSGGGASVGQQGQADESLHICYLRAVL